MTDTMARPDRLIVTGLGGIDGAYEFNLAGLLELDNPDTITQREAHKIKQLTGLRLGELEDAMEAGDADVVIAVAVVVLDRSGKRYDPEALWKAPLGALLIEPGGDREPDVEADADPLPVSEPPPTEKPQPSGGGSGDPPSAAKSPNGQKGTGSRSSATPIGGQDSALATWET